MQGITFGVGFSTATVYSGKLAPPQLASTFQVGKGGGCCVPASPTYHRIYTVLYCTAALQTQSRILLVLAKELLGFE